MTFQHSGNRRIRIGRIHITRRIAVLTRTLTIRTRTRTTSSLLTFTSLIIQVLRHTSLRRIQIIPSLTRHKVTRSRPHKLIRTRRSFLIFRGRIMYTSIITIFQPTFSFQISKVAILISTRVSLIRMATIYNT